MIKKATIGIGLIALLAGGTAAQPSQSDFVASVYRLDPSPHSYNNGAVYRISPTGGFTTLTTWSYRGAPELFGPVIENDNRRVRFQWADGGSMLRMDPATNAITTITTSLSPDVILSMTGSNAGGFLYAEAGYASPSIRFLEVSAAGAVSTLRSIPSWSTALLPRIRLQDQDLWTGDYWLTMDAVSSGPGQFTQSSAHSVARLSANGQRLNVVSPALIGGPAVWAQGAIAQSHIDGDLRLVTGQYLLRLNPVSGMATTLTTLPGYAGAALFESTGSGGMITVLTDRALMHLTPGGQTIASYPTPQSLSAPRRIVRLGSRNIAPVRRASPNDWDLGVSFPNEPGRPFVLALSASGFTAGLRIGGRAVALVPDALFALCLRGAFAPLRGNIGTLSGTGSGTARLDLRFLGNRVSGVPLWAAAVTLDPSRPSGIGSISKPVVIALD